MDAYSTVFGERYQSQLEKEAGIRAMFKGVGRGLKQTMDQSAATSLVKKRRKATSALRNTRDQQQAMFQQAQDTLDAAKSKSGLGRLWGNIKGNYLNAKAEGLSDKMGDLNRRINRYDNKLGNNAFYQARQNKVLANRADLNSWARPIEKPVTPAGQKIDVKQIDLNSPATLNQSLGTAQTTQATQRSLNFGDSDADIHFAQTPVTSGNITGAPQFADGTTINLPNKVQASAPARVRGRGKYKSKRELSADNTTGTGSGLIDGQMPAAKGQWPATVQKPKPQPNAARAANNALNGTPAPAKAAPADVAATQAQTKAVASDTMNGAAPAPVKGQPAAPQPAVAKGDAAPAPVQPAAPQPTVPKGKGNAAPDATQPTAPQPTAPKKPVKPTPPAQQADPDLPPTPQGGAPQGGVPQQGMMNPQGYMPQGYMQPYPFAMQAPQQGMSASEKWMLAGMLGNLSMPAYMYMMSRNNDE